LIAHDINQAKYNSTGCVHGCLKSLKTSIKTIHFTCKGCMLHIVWF